MPPERSEFREAMARLGAAVNIVTTSGPEGDTGFTASAVCSITDDPATLCVCMNRASSQFPAFRDAVSLCVNILGADGEELSRIFAGQKGMTMAERFQAARWTRLSTSAPVLESAAAALDCAIAQSFNIGTHQVFFCEVKEIWLATEPSGLVYHSRRYHPLAALPG